MFLTFCQQEWEKEGCNIPVHSFTPVKVTHNLCTWLLCCANCH